VLKSDMGDPDMFRSCDNQPAGPEDR
jgi:hypothetical protein